MSQPFEVLGHSSSLLFNAHGCSSDGNAPFSLLSNDTLFEYETFTDLNDLFLSVSLASEKKIVYDLIGEVPSAQRRGSKEESSVLRLMSRNHGPLPSSHRGVLYPHTCSSGIASGSICTAHRCKNRWWQVIRRQNFEVIIITCTRRTHGNAIVVLIATVAFNSITRCEQVF